MAKREKETKSDLKILSRLELKGLTRLETFRIYSSFPATSQLKPIRAEFAEREFGDESNPVLYFTVSDPLSVVMLLVLFEGFGATLDLKAVTSDELEAATKEGAFPVKILPEDSFLYFAAIFVGNLVSLRYWEKEAPTKLIPSILHEVTLTQTGKIGAGESYKTLQNVNMDILGLLWIYWEDKDWWNFANKLRMGALSLEKALGAIEERLENGVAGGVARKAKPEAAVDDDVDPMVEGGLSRSKKKERMASVGVNLQGRADYKFEMDTELLVQIPHGILSLSTAHLIDEVVNCHDFYLKNTQPSLVRRAIALSKKRGILTLRVNLGAGVNAKEVIKLIAKWPLVTRGYRPGIEMGYIPENSSLSDYARESGVVKFSLWRSVVNGTYMRLDSTDISSRLPGASFRASRIIQGFKSTG